MFVLDCETAHDVVVRLFETARHVPGALGIVHALYAKKFPALEQKVADLMFPNPVGLAAGWDKSARVPAALAAMGFGFLELGTVTFWPEKGQPRPRIFKSNRGQWIINRVGFANDGVDQVAWRLRHMPKTYDCTVGVSLGKMPASPPGRLGVEVSAMLEILYPYVSFFSVNVSSPNTPYGWLLAREEVLRKALSYIRTANFHVANRLGRIPKPLFVKIAPSESRDDIEILARILVEEEMSGIIATNSMPTPRGGLSGLPLRQTALKTTARLHRALKGAIPIIGVGGILTPEDAWQRITAGASLVQIFSGFVFSGPALIGRILKYLDGECRRAGLKTIEEACGIYAERYAQ